MTAGASLTIGIVIFRLTPAGGLEQHALRLSALLVERGHKVTLITTQAPAAAPPRGVRGEQYPARGRTNHGRLAAFAEDAAHAAADRFDVTVAFHAIPGFDVIFCADPSRARPHPLRALLPRYRAYAQLERAALAPASRSLVLCLSAAQRGEFLHNTEVAADRLIVLPPTVERIAVANQRPSPAERWAARSELELPDHESVWLWMGLQPRTKGLDRALRALAAFPASRLVVTGLERASRGGVEADYLSRRLGVRDRVRWLGFCEAATLRQARVASDLLLHPSRADVTGTVILEAMASGLPVITTEVCGYSEHVARAQAGIVLSEPFSAADLERALGTATLSRQIVWSTNALAYARRDELYTGLERAADLIEGVALTSPAPQLASGELDWHDEDSEDADTSQAY
jgi:UDP-glucose:(heptosyl)LPS alpha-1,3-glucosyltransferase